MAFSDQDYEACTALPCSNCLATMYEDRARCPKCGEILRPEGPLPARTIGWIVIVGLLGLVRILYALW